MVLPPCRWGIEQERAVVVRQAWQGDSAAGTGTDPLGCAGSRDFLW